ncbi:MAG: endonuclease/exonuclease/phosphatase family protein [Paracoccaceae bacterium]|nr:endonuclease/exonuclease/phosphatase family protein [Paracoccaceae bacterium]MDG2258957.1 endonuclease/exonuclease/phosphatase family protein [Paracoccaceae bacterium]
MTRKTVRVASYNIRKARGLDQKYAPQRIIEVNNRLGADVIALQEADHRLGARPAALPHRMIEEETDFQIIPVATNGISLGYHGNAVLARKSLGTATIRHIPLTGLEPRGAARVDFETIGLSIVAAHLGLLRSNRRKQLSEIRDATGDAGPTVIAGDFNEWRKRTGLEPLDGFTVHAPGQSFHARRPVAALDRIALSSGIELRDAGVEQGPLASRASDHLPIWADVEV